MLFVIVYNVHQNRVIMKWATTEFVWRHSWQLWKPIQRY